jgi:uncharacterized membrane protein
MLVGFFLWKQLPENIATHFGANGEADGWSSKEFAVIGLPCMMLGFQWLTVLIVGADPKNQNISDKMFTLIAWIMPVVSVFSCSSIYLHEFNKSYDVTMIGYILVGFMFLIVGNYLPKMKQSYTLGIKLPWTLNSTENWNRTHRMASWLWMLCGVFVLMAGFMKVEWLIVVFAAVAVLVPTAYSYILYKKGI